MPQVRTYNIRCPKCGQEQDVELHDSLNVQNDPDLKDALMANQLNAVTCPACQFSFRVDKPLLYNDPERRFMIYLNPAGSGDARSSQEAFMTWMAELSETLPAGVESPDVHLVFDRTELVERIFLLEAGLNERVIEYIKHFIYSKNLDRIDPRVKALLFDAQDSSDKTLCFVVQDVATHQLESVIEYSREAYDGLCEMFDRDDQTPSLMELFPGPHISARVLFLADAKVDS